MYYSLHDYTSTLRLLRPCLLQNPVQFRFHRPPPTTLHAHRLLRQAPCTRAQLPAQFYTLVLSMACLEHGGGASEVSGSPTENAILQWGVKLGMDFDAVQSDSVIIQAFPFNSEKSEAVLN